MVWLLMAFLLGVLYEKRGTTLWWWVSFWWHKARGHRREARESE